MAHRKTHTAIFMVVLPITVRDWRQTKVHWQWEKINSNTGEGTIWSHGAAQTDVRDSPEQKKPDRVNTARPWPQSSKEELICSWRTNPLRLADTQRRGNVSGAYWGNLIVHFLNLSTGSMVSATL